MSPALPPSSAQVVVIDDEPEIGELLEAACRSVGLSCAVTADYERFRQALGAGTRLLIIDLMMPGVDGIEILRRLAGEGCRASVLLISGFDKRVLSAAEKLAQSLGLHVAGSLVKPFRLAEAEALLTRVRTRSESGDRAPRAARRLAPEELREALAAGRTVVHYQPQIELAGGRLVGAEALVRLLDARGSLVYPDAFIGVAERSGQIEALTIAVFRRALSDFADLGLGPGGTVSINSSALTLTDVTLPDRIDSYAAHKRLRPANVVFEITESGLIKELATTLDILTRLRLKGYGLSIDDFGTGFSSMEQLRRIPATELKIDRQFVSSMLKDDSASAVAVKTIELGHALGMKVVAEGVETEEQAAALRRQRCDIGQGYLFGKPMPLAAFQNWVREKAG